MHIANPFVVGGYISPHYFCDREVETELLIRNITMVGMWLLFLLAEWERQG